MVVEVVVVDKVVARVPVPDLAPWSLMLGQWSPLRGSHGPSAKGTKPEVKDDHRQEVGFAWILENPRPQN